MATNNNIAQEVEMNEILVTPVLASNTALVLNYSLYDIESVNTTQMRILASAAETTERQDTTNVFYVQKISDEAELLTAVPEGKVRLTKTAETEAEAVDLFTVALLPAEVTE